MGWDDTQIILIWSKPVDYSQVTDYKVYRDGIALGLSGRFDTNRAKLYYIVTGLTPNTTYNFTVKSLNSSGTELATSNTCSKTTANTPTVLNIANPPYNAVNNGSTKNTTAIQNAINDCPAGGVVLVPAGGTGYLTGSIFLKSNMTLRIDGTLIGSSAAADYKWTCWRFPYYASGKNHMGLVNAYYDYNNPSSYGKPYGTITNVRICGSGVINGCQGYSASNPHTVTDLTTLGTNEAAAHGDSSRGDLVTIKGINQVYVGGWGGPLTLVYPAMHTIFLSYCNGVTINDVNCDTYDIHNGDGINLCTSDTAYIFNSKFDTGDDCINMNAGQGQQGVDENVPDQNIRVFDCSTDRGHGGYVIGSFTAAWVQDSLIEDCFFKNTDISNGIGIRMKTGKRNGGGGRRITCRDIRISGPSKQGILLDTHYNQTDYNDAGAGQFSGNTFKNITVSSTGATIDVNGWEGPTPPAKPHTNNIFDHITGDKAASLNWCTNSTFSYVNVTVWSPYTNCSGNINGGGNSPAPPF
jgi:exo-poly-alpha-galacturonosidase